MSPEGVRCERAGASPEQQAEWPRQREGGQGGDRNRSHRTFSGFKLLLCVKRGVLQGSEQRSEAEGSGHTQSFQRLFD